MHHVPFLGSWEIRAWGQLTSEAPSGGADSGIVWGDGSREFLVINICFQNGNSHLEKSNSCWQFRVDRGRIGTGLVIII